MNEMSLGGIIPICMHCIPTTIHDNNKNKVEMEGRELSMDSEYGTTHLVEVKNLL